MFKRKINQSEKQEDDEHDVEEEENSPRRFSLALRVADDGLDQIQMGTGSEKERKKERKK